jgi:hypothetical protein
MVVTRDPDRDPVPGPIVERVKTRALPGTGVHVGHHPAAVEPGRPSDHAP